jgi:hypothetical protein
LSTPRSVSLLHLFRHLFEQPVQPRVSERPGRLGKVTSKSRSNPLNEFAEERRQNKVEGKVASYQHPDKQHHQYGGFLLRAGVCPAECPLFLGCRLLRRRGERRCRSKPRTRISRKQGSVARTYVVSSDGTLTTGAASSESRKAACSCCISAHKAFHLSWTFALLHFEAIIFLSSNEDLGQFIT